MNKLLKFILILLSIHVTNVYSIECLSYSCSSLKGNCIKCSKISIVTQTIWEDQIKQQIYVYEQLQRVNEVHFLKDKLLSGPYCCKIYNANRRCALLYQFGHPDEVPFYNMDCTDFGHLKSMICSMKNVHNKCCVHNHCNIADQVHLEFIRNNTLKKFHILSHNSINKQEKNIYKYIYVIMSGILLIVLILVIRIKFCSKHLKRFTIEKGILPQFKELKFYLCISRKRIQEDSLKKKHLDENFVNNLSELSCSGSGAGAPMMTPKTAASDISLVRYVGEGRFGCVRQGYWNGDSVAVKIFSSRDERAWSREKTVYQQNYLRHVNILEFITADSRDNGISTELWLVTEFHENGSLFDFLKSHTISVEDLVKMTRSITNGIAYLHMEINGIECKPAIAHRDLKSRNILVKSCGECCIGDLGLAVRLNSRCNDIRDVDGINNNGSNEKIAEVGRISIEEYRVGTRRYMAPEILDGSLEPLILATINENSNDIFNGSNTAAIESLGEAFKRADIYSYSLVIWEIFRRVKCPILGINEFSHELPYQSEVNGDPSIEDMYNVVCKQGLRPPISPQWTNTAGSSNSMVEIRAEVVRTICQAMRESWFANPASRLSIMRLKKIMGLAASQLQMQQKQQQQELHQHLSQQEQHQQFQQESGNSIDSLNNILSDPLTSINQFSQYTATNSLNNSSQKSITATEMILLSTKDSQEMDRLVD